MKTPKEKKVKSCSLSHEPNAETAKVLSETDKRKNLIEYETLDDFWDELGFNKYT